MIMHPKRWLVISWSTIIVSILIIVFVKPLWGVDFTGGSLIEIEAEASSVAAAQTLLKNSFDLQSTIQTTQDGTLIIRTVPLQQDKVDEISAALKEGNITTKNVLRFESIGPTIGKELRKNSWTAISIVLIAMIIYLAYTFRGMKSLMAPWKFGVAAIFALIHDMLVVTALFVLLGKFKGVPLDTLFVTAQLAIFGYSVNDTIIIFDRLKSEWISTRSGNLLQIMDKSIRSTLTRSLNTSLTILIVLLSLLIFGGTSIYWFIVALTIGTIVGTYSSIFVASTFLHYLSKK